MIPALIGAGATLLGGAIAAGSNLATNNKNYAFQSANLDYQKALQQKIFEREDTAIERRKQDLINAGFNPYLAMNGNGAGSGAVVSTTPQHIDSSLGPLAQAVQQMPGAFVDMMRSLEAYKQDKVHTESMLMNNIDLGNFLAMEYGAEYNGQINIPDYFHNKYSSYDYDWMTTNSVAGQRRNTMKKSFGFDADSLPFEWQMLMDDVEDSTINLELLRKRRDFAVADKIEQYIMDAIGALTGASNSARGWYDSNARQRGNYNQGNYNSYRR